MERRTFLVGLAASQIPLAASQSAAQEALPRKIKLGWIGCGNRGAWLIKLFQQHGGFTVHAIADYFQEEVDRCGDALGVDKTRRFTGLSGASKVLDSGVEAVGILDVPRFHPEHAQAAVAANCHVYLAKPVAIDTWGCLIIEAAGKLATRKNLSFLVDYQMSTAPVNVEIYRRIREGALGKLLAVTTIGTGGVNAKSYPPRELPKGKTIESRLRKGIWTSDNCLAGDRIVEYDVHAIEGAVHAIGHRAEAAVGYLRIVRPNPQSDYHDNGFIIYECPGGLLWNHQTICVPDHGPTLVCNINGSLASAQIRYRGTSFIRGGPMGFPGDDTGKQFEDSAIRNIGTFYRSIIEGRSDNPTVQSSVDATLTAVLGREAAARGRRLTMEELLRENLRIPVDLTGLKV
jgi:myo-inositol 2-dehydrogenase / D-chiro-inositol 1-dehydrogenase